MLGLPVRRGGDVVAAPTRAELDWRVSRPRQTLGFRVRVAPAHGAATDGT